MRGVAFFGLGGCLPLVWVFLEREREGGGKKKTKEPEE